MAAWCRLVPYESDASAFLFDVITRFSDVVGEKGIASLLQYSAAEVASDMWSRALPPRREHELLARVEGAVGARIQVISTTEDRVTVRVDLSRLPPHSAPARRAILTGFVQGLHRRKTGRIPEVDIEAAPSQEKTEEKDHA